MTFAERGVLSASSARTVEEVVGAGSVEYLSPGTTRYESGPHEMASSAPISSRKTEVRPLRILETREAGMRRPAPSRRRSDVTRELNLGRTGGASVAADMVVMSCDDYVGGGAAKRKESRSNVQGERKRGGFESRLKGDKRPAFCIFVAFGGERKKEKLFHLLCGGGGV